MGKYIRAYNDTVSPIMQSKPKLSARFGLTMKYSFTSPRQKWGECQGDTGTDGGLDIRTSIREEP